MSHVDEGTLHSYLDGELSPDERQAVENHLSQCAPCSASLAEEQALRERASAVLGAARPLERPMPPFEQLRRTSKPSPWRVRRSIAWAASIVLAIGIGYSVRGVSSREAADTYALYDRPDAPAAQTQPATAERERKTRPPARRPTPAPVPNEVTLQQKPERVDSLSQLSASSGQAAAPVPGVSRVAAAAGEREDEIRPALNAAKARADVAGSLVVINRQMARALLGEEPVGLPGLTPRSFRRTPDGTVVVEQALDPSTFIQIFQRPASPASLADSGAAYTRGFAFARTDRLLARYVGRLRVEIAGPVSTDSLNKLLQQVTPLP
jgi:hypothetical protein